MFMPYCISPSEVLRYPWETFLRSLKIWVIFSLGGLVPYDYTMYNYKASWPFGDCSDQEA